MQPADAPDELVVRSDNQVLRKRFRTIIIVNAVLLLLSMAAIGVITMLHHEALRFSVFVFIILVLSSVFQIAIQCYFWGGRLAISRPLVIDWWGLEFQGHAGTVRLPWEAVTQVQHKQVMGQSQLVFAVHPQAVPGQNGVEAEPRTWPRFLKSGVVLGNLGLIPGVETILPAVHHYSQGRIQIA